MDTNALFNSVDMGDKGQTMFDFSYEQEKTPQSPTPPASLNKTSQVLALAQTDPSKPDLFGQMQDLIDKTRETIATVGDVDIRRQIASKATLRDTESLISLYQDRSYQDPNLVTGAMMAAQQVLAQDQERRAQYAAEQEAVKRIQDLAAEGDTGQARMLIRNMETGNSDKVIRDENAKNLMLARALDNIKGEIDDDDFSIVSGAANFILNALPLYGSTGQVGNVDVEKHLKGYADWLLSGRRLQVESNALRNMPIEEFGDYLNNVLLPKLKDKSILAFFEDKRKEYATLSKLKRPSGVLGQNAEDALANFGWIGPAELSRAASIPGLLIRNGARKETGELLAKAAIDLKTYGAEEAAKRTGIETDELVDHMLPHAVNPEAQTFHVGGVFTGPEISPIKIKAINPDGSYLLEDEFGPFQSTAAQLNDNVNLSGFEYTAPETEAVSSMVSVQSDVNSIITRTEKLMGKFKDLQQLGRLTKDEMMAAIEDTKLKIKKEFGDDIVKDIAVKDVKLSDGTSVKRVEFTLGKFSTPDEAIRWAESMGLGKDVPIEGFASNLDRQIRILRGVPTKDQPLFKKLMAKTRITVDGKEGSEPLKLYHGTTKQHDTFDPTKSNYYGNLLFFASDPHTTLSFNAGHGPDPLMGKSIPVYINAVNPFDPKNNPEHQAMWIDFLTKHPEGKKLGYGTAYDWEGNTKGFDPNIISNEVKQGYWGAMEKKQAVDWIKSQGYDSFWIWSKTEGRNLVVWDAEKIINAIEPSDLATKVVRDDSGEYFVRASRDVSEVGFHTDLTTGHSTGLLSRIVLSARSIGDRFLANRAQGAGNTRAKLLKTFVSDWGKTFAVLSRKEREALSQVLAAGEQQAMWFERDGLELMYQRGFNRAPTEREVAAYNAARDLNDIEYMLRNDELYKQKVVNGFETVKFDTGSGSIPPSNGKIISDWSVLPTDRIYNVSDGISYSKVNPMLADDMVRLKEEGYVLVQLDHEAKMLDGTTTRTVLAKKSDLVTEPLRREQINYRPGGHRIYEGKYFGKQARIGVQPDGEKFLSNPSTFIVGNTKAEVQRWVSQMEQGRQLYLNGASAEEIHAVIPPYMDGNDFVNKMLDGTFDPDHEFRVAFDRETLPEYMNTAGYADMRDLDTTNVEQFLRTNGRMYYSHKGEVLQDWQGAMAPTLDPFKVINQSLMNVANLSSFSDYKITAAARWHSTYGGWLSQQGVSPMQALREGTFGPNVPEAIRQSAEAQRDVIKRALGWRTEFDRQQEIYARRFTEWVMGDDPYSMRHKIASAVTNWWDTNDPVQALRGLAFDLKLGLMNVAQFPLQIGTMIAAASISPKYGMHGMMGLFPMRAYLTKSGTEHMLDTLVSRGVHTMAGFENPAEFKEFMREAKRSGFMDVGGTHILINDYGPSAAVGAFKRLDSIREASRFWFYEGELWNRMVAWRIAWGETRDAFPQLATNSKEFLAEVAGKSEEFAFSMSDQSAAAWQKGITSIPTQFWAYNARMLEAMFGKTFTTEQKLRLVLGQSMLYGAAGVPIAPFVLEQINKNRGSAAPVNSVEGMVSRGLMDQVIYHITGQDLLVSKRYGTGSFITDLPVINEVLHGIFGMSGYGEKSIAEVVGGASLNITYQGFETIYDTLSYMAAESGSKDMPLTRDALMRLASNISTVSNLHKSWMAFQYGTLMTNKGTTVANDVPTATAFAIALGISPGEADQVTAAMNYKQKQDEAVTEAVKVLTNYRTRMVNEPANRTQINEEINVYVRLLPEDVRAKALRQTNRVMQPSLLDALTLQVERDRARAEALTAMEGNNGSDGNP